MEKIPNITGLRFFLALCVVLFHTSEFCSKHNIPFYNGLSIFNKGHEAVCVFFSLSGFLIIRQLYIEKATFLTISLKNFYIRRSLRIFPLYFLVLFYGLAHYHLILPSFGYEGDYNTTYNLWEGIALSVFFMPNVFASLYSPGGIIEILWSIGVEEQFYLIIAPLLLLLPLKKYVHFLVVLTIIIFLIYFYIEHNFLAQFGILFFYFTASGVVSILLFERKIKFNSKVINFILLALFVAYFTTDFFVSSFSSANYNLFSMLLFALVVGVLSGTSYDLLNNKKVTYLGKISYGIYMFHAIVIQITGLLYTKLFNGVDLNDSIIIIIYNLIVIVTTVLVSHFSYQYYEKFFMKFYPTSLALRKNLH